MNLFKYITSHVILTIVLAVGFAPTAIAADDHEIRVATTSNGRSKVRHPNGYPLIIEVTITNPDAANTLLDNIATKANTKIPAVTIGSDARPFTSSIRFVAVDSQGKQRSISLRLLQQPGGVLASRTTLDGRGMVTCFFGLDPESFPSDSTLKITSALDSDAVSPGGTTIDTRPIEITSLAPDKLNKAEMVAVNFEAGEFFILDKHPNLAEPYAAKLDALSPQLAASLRAEMYLGSGEVDKAHAACKQALTLYIKNTMGEQNAEPPTYLFALLDKIEKAGGK